MSSCALIDLHVHLDGSIPLPAAAQLAAEAGLDGLQGIDSLKVCRTSQAHVSENGLLVKPL